MFGLALVVAIFFTQGLPLFDQDYSLWIAQAHASPWSWDRPLKVAIYALLERLVGPNGGVFYFLKSLTFALSAAALFRLIRRLGVEMISALLAVSLWALSPLMLGPLVVHSQFAIYSQLATFLLLLFSWDYFFKSSKPTPRVRTRFLAIFLGSVFLGSRLGPEIVCVPLVWLFYFRTFDRAKFKQYAFPLGVSLLISIPFSKGVFTQLPSFLPGATASAGANFVPFSLLRMVKVLFAQPLSFAEAPASLVSGGLGLGLVLGLIAFFVDRMRKGEVARLDSRRAFSWIWLGTGILAASVLQGAGIYGEHAAVSVALAPAVVCLSWILKRSLPVAIVLIGITNVHHIYQSGGMRAIHGRTALAYHQAYQSIEAEMPNAHFVYLPGTPAYAFRNSEAQALRGRYSIGGTADLARSAPQTTVGLAFSPPLDTSFSLRRHYSGCGSLFDLVVPCPHGGGLFLMTYLGVPPEIETARRLEQARDLHGAARTYEAYLQTEPNNHGVIFSLSLLYDRLQMHEQFEAMNDRLGPYHWDHPSVVYNWGLSKMRVRKYSDAVRYLEKAYSFYPNSYGPGFNLADAYHSAGMRRKAIRLLESLLVQYAGDPTMTQILNQWKSEK